MEVVFLPYSVYSHECVNELIDLLHKMGYATAKLYPGDKVSKD